MNAKRFVSTFHVVLFLSITVLLCFTVPSCAAPKVRVTTAPGFSLSSVRKVLVLPVLPSMEEIAHPFELRQLSAELTAATVRTLAGRVTVKTVGQVHQDILLSSGNVPYDLDDLSSLSSTEWKDFLKRARDTGVEVALAISSNSGFDSQFVQGYSIPYTSYNYANFSLSGPGGTVRGSAMVPQQSYTNIPAHEEWYLYTGCQVEVWDLNKLDRSSAAATVATGVYSLSKRYQGGDFSEISKVVRNVVDTTVNGLFQGVPRSSGSPTIAPQSGTAKQSGDGSSSEKPVQRKKLYEWRREPGW